MKSEFKGNGFALIFGEQIEERVVCEQIQLQSVVPLLEVTVVVLAEVNLLFLIQQSKGV